MGKYSDLPTMEDYRTTQEDGIIKAVSKDIEPSDEYDLSLFIMVTFMKGLF